MNINEILDLELTLTGYSEPEPTLGEILRFYYRSDGYPCPEAKARLYAGALKRKLVDPKGEFKSVREKQEETPDPFFTLPPKSFEIDMDSVRSEMCANYSAEFVDSELLDVIVASALIKARGQQFITEEDVELVLRALDGTVTLDFMERVRPPNDPDAPDVLVEPYDILGHIYAWYHEKMFADVVTNEKYCTKYVQTGLNVFMGAFD